MVKKVLDLHNQTATLEARASVGRNTNLGSRRDDHDIPECNNIGGSRRKPRARADVGKWGEYTQATGGSRHERDRTRCGDAGWNPNMVWSSGQSRGSISGIQSKKTIESQPRAEVTELILIQLHNDTSMQKGLTHSASSSLGSCFYAVVKKNKKEPHKVFDTLPIDSQIPTVSIFFGSSKLLQSKRQFDINSPRDNRASSLLSLQKSELRDTAILSIRFRSQVNKIDPRTAYAHPSSFQTLDHGRRSTASTAINVLKSVTDVLINWQYKEREVRKECEDSSESRSPTLSRTQPPATLSCVFSFKWSTTSSKRRKIVSSFSVRSIRSFTTSRGSATMAETPAPQRTPLKGNPSVLLEGMEKIVCVERKQKRCEAIRRKVNSFAELGELRSMEIYSIAAARFPRSRDGSNVAHLRSIVRVVVDHSRRLEGSAKRPKTETSVPASTKLLFFVFYMQESLLIF
ncbi:hypothetical protein M5K25_022783 [Dendrobium thyrsiflorum]|uniref:Uncharacterized protein n=1 Tax=Dendrobium thyrsiflorum TaxID=117978 RepID=A0ABD0U6X2_DENTH